MIKINVQSLVKYTLVIAYNNRRCNEYNLS